MPYTQHYNLPEMPVGAVDWPAIINDIVAKIERGRTLKLTAAVDLDKGEPIYINASGQAAKATDATPCHGVWLDTITLAGAQGYAQRTGVMTTGSGWTVGGAIYVSAASTLTQAAPSGSAVPIGVAISATVVALAVFGFNGTSVLALQDGANLALGTATGSKFGTAANQKLGLWGVTPVVQPAHANQAAVVLGNSDNEIGGLTFSASPTQAECQALRDKCEELADDVRTLSVLVHAMRTALISFGAIKRSA